MNIHEKVIIERKILHHFLMLFYGQVILKIVALKS
jgi:hypothetical protein